MLDQEHGHFARQRRNGGEDIVPLAFGNAGGRLIQQQHARFGGDRDRDLQQTLLAIGQRSGEVIHDIKQMETRQIFRYLGVDILARAHLPPPIAAAAEPFRYREPNGLQRCQIGIELIDLERARQSAQHSCMHGQARDVVSVQQNAPAIGPEYARQQIDGGGLAGAVRPDQGMAGALLDAERKIPRHLQAAKLLFQALRFQG